MSGLIGSYEGLSYGEGLTFERYLGGAGLTNPVDVQGPLAHARLGGAGALSAATRLRAAARTVMGGTGAVSASADVVTP